LSAKAEVAHEAQREARRPWIGYLGRLGLAAQGVCFGIIGALAIGLAVGAGGEATDPQGAFHALARDGWTRILLIVLVIGFLGYAIWRFAQALFDRGGMGSDMSGLGRRAIQLVQGLIYVGLTVSALRILLGGKSNSGKQRHLAAGVLGWPGGRELVGMVAVVLLVIGGVTAYWALSRRFKESLATGEMGPGTERLVTALGLIGLLSLAVISAVVAGFLFKAAIQFDPRDAVSLGGALGKLAHADYGSYLLGLIATGLIVFACFDLFQARYHQA
jgi:hypothetical protein